LPPLVCEYPFSKQDLGLQHTEVACTILSYAQFLLLSFCTWQEVHHKKRAALPERQAWTLHIGCVDDELLPHLQEGEMSISRQNESTTFSFAAQHYPPSGVEGVQAPDQINTTSLEISSRQLLRSGTLKEHTSQVDTNAALDPEDPVNEDLAVVGALHALQPTCGNKAPHPVQRT